LEALTRLVEAGQLLFAAPDVVEVDGRQLRFKKAVLATGSGPLIPAIDGLKSGEYLTNESVFSLTALPSRLVVIGGGPLGCELAQAFCRLGSEVDLVSDTEQLLPRDEPETGALWPLPGKRWLVRLLVSTGRCLAPSHLVEKDPEPSAPGKLAKNRR
jgi:pyruvate/2-oxoglutarate dehydrogenase complex dihydrolipoamide dehydrogenase (E3) component